MTKSEWILCAKKLCSLYQKDYTKHIPTLAEYYSNSAGETTTLGGMKYFEFGLILDFLKENIIKPDYGAIPQYYQLLEIYKKNVLPNKIFDSNAQKKYTEQCELCDDTGFVPIFDLEKNSEKVCCCICSRGRAMRQAARGYKKKHDNTYIESWETIKKEKKFILRGSATEKIRQLAKEYSESNNFSKETMLKNKYKIREILHSI